MLPLNDPRWRSYQGGYRKAYDASPVLARLLGNASEQDTSREDVWDELWTELHHQGDVGSASYAAVPWLVEFIRRSPRLDWNAIALISTIELLRDQADNPPVPAELSSGYTAAIEALPEVLTSHPDRQWDEPTVQAAVACIALARGQRWFARAYFELDRDTAGQWFSEEFGWDFPDE